MSTMKEGAFICQKKKDFSGVLYQVLQRQEIILYPGWTVFFMAFQK